MFGINNDEPWMENAKCANDRNLTEWQKANREDQFFDEFSGFKGNEQVTKQRRKRARDYCADGCPVQAECLAYALRNNEQGIWAGTTERQRRALRKKAQRSVELFLARQQVQSPGDSGPIAS